MGINNNNMNNKGLFKMITKKKMQRYYGNSKGFLEEGEIGGCLELQRGQVFSR